MSNDKSHTFLAFVLGGIVGAAIAILYAPDSGRETRRRIKDGFDDAEDWARDKYDDAKDAVESGTEKVKTIVGERKEDIKSAYEAGKDAYFRGKEKLFKKEPV